MRILRNLFYFILGLLFISLIIAFIVFLFIELPYKTIFKYVFIRGGAIILSLNILAAIIKPSFPNMFNVDM